MPLFARLRRSTTPAPAATDAAPGKRRWPKVLAGLALFGLALMAFVFFAGPPIVKSILVSKGAELLGRPVSVGEIRIDPLQLAVEVEQFAILEPQGGQRFVAFDRLRVDLEWESVYRRAPVLAEVLLEKPYVHVVRLAGRRFNFTDLIEKFATPDDPDKPPAKFSINNIRVRGGAVDVDDRPAGTRHRIRELDLAIPFVSNLPYFGHIFVQPAFSAKVNGAPFALQGRTKPFTPGRESILALKFQGVDVPFYWRYVPIDPPYRLASARLDVDAGVTFSQPPDGTTRLTVAGKVAVRDVQVDDLDGKPLVGFQRLDVATDGIDAFGRQVPLKLVKLSGASVTVHRAADGTLNLSALGKTARGEAPAAAPAAPAADKASPAREITVAALEIDGTVAFTDETVQPAFAGTVKPVAVQISGLSTSGDAPPATVKLTAATDAGETVAVAGTVGIGRVQWDLDASLEKLPLARYAAYYRDAVLFDIGSGTLGLAAHVAGAAASDGLVLTVAAAKATLDDLRLRRPGQPRDFLSLARLDVEGGSLDLGKREAAIGEVRLMKPVVEGRRARDGTLDLSRLTPPAKAATAPSTATATPPGETAGSAWTIALKHLLLDQGQVHVVDEVPTTAVDVRLAPLRLELADLAIGRPATSKFDVRTRINGKGESTLSGTFALDPPAVDARVKVADLDVLPFQPYFADRVRATLTGASLSTAGHLTVSIPRSRPPAIGYDGTATLARFAAVDTQGSEPLIQWESLFLDGLQVRTEPFSLGIRNVALSDFAARVQINADGTLNLQNAVAGDSAPPSTDPAVSRPAPKAAPPTPKPAAESPATSPVPRSIKIDQVTLQGGTIHFSDRLIKPNVAATLTEVGGRVSGLLSDASTRADVDLRGKLASQSPLSITGQVNPLSGDLFADLKVDFHDIELPPFTPYAGRYAGYTIEKGKLSLALSYRIEKRQIRAENRIRIDQFTFGNKVESPDATGLPVQLAVSLLKDRDGRINLDVPVSGSLDDPKFKLGRVIWQVIVNLITKAVTAPFALIGSLFGGGGEELSYVDFAPGQATPDAAGQAKLEQLGKALRDRPALRLDVVGRVNGEKDREALRRTAYERKVKTQKFNELAKQGTAPASVEMTALDPAEFERYLRKAYRQEKFPKPRNAIGLEKDLPREEMEKLMLTNLVVTDDDLRQLAMRRAQGVKESLTASGEIASERVFLIEPGTAGADAKDKPATSRVEFVLK
ncbi:MAG: DUF748 domain-containing protein [Burkholderiales bacterium]